MILSLCLSLVWWRIDSSLGNQDNIRDPLQVESKRLEKRSKVPVQKAVNSNDIVETSTADDEVKQANLRLVESWREALRGQLAHPEDFLSINPRHPFYYKLLQALVEADGEKFQEIVWTRLVESDDEWHTKRGLIKALGKINLNSLSQEQRNLWMERIWNLVITGDNVISPNQPLPDEFKINAAETFVNFLEQTHQKERNKDFVDYLTHKDEVSDAVFLVALRRRFYSLSTINAMFEDMGTKRRMILFKNSMIFQEERYHETWITLLMRSSFAEQLTLINTLAAWTPQNRISFLMVLENQKLDNRLVKIARTLKY